MGTVVNFYIPDTVDYSGKYNLRDIFGMTTFSALKNPDKVLLDTRTFEQKDQVNNGYAYHYTNINGKNKDVYAFLVKKSATYFILVMFALDYDANNIPTVHEINFNSSSGSSPYRDRDIEFTTYTNSRVTPNLKKHGFNQTHQYIPLDAQIYPSDIPIYDMSNIEKADSLRLSDLIMYLDPNPAAATVEIPVQWNNLETSFEISVS